MPVVGLVLFGTGIPANLAAAQTPGQSAQQLQKLQELKSMAEASVWLNARHEAGNEKWSEPVLTAQNGAPRISAISANDWSHTASNDIR